MTTTKKIENCARNVSDFKGIRYNMNEGFNYNKK